MSSNTNFETNSAFYFIQDEILNLVYKKGISVDLDNVKENLKLRQSFQKGKKLLVLIDVTEVWDYSSDAKEFAASQDVADLSIAQAIIIGRSLPTIILANFYIKVNRPKVPTKLFGSRESAIDWLEQFKESSDPQHPIDQTDIAKSM